MAKMASLFAEDRSHVADIEIGDDFYGYPKLLDYDEQFYLLQDDRRGFQLAAVNSADYQVYMRTEFYVVPVEAPAV